MGRKNYSYTRKGRVNKKSVYKSAITYDTTSFYQIDYNGKIKSRWVSVKDLIINIGYTDKDARSISRILNNSKDDKIYNGFYWIKTCEYKSDINYHILIKYLKHINIQKSKNYF